MLYLYPLSRSVVRDQMELLADPQALEVRTVLAYTLLPNAFWVRIHECLNRRVVLQMVYEGISNLLYLLADDDYKLVMDILMKAFNNGRE
jgi:hypothetical protein